MTPILCCGVPPVQKGEGDEFSSLSCPVCGCYVIARGDVVARWNAYQMIGVEDHQTAASLLTLED